MIELKKNKKKPWAGGSYAQIFLNFLDLLFFYENKTRKSLQLGGTDTQIFVKV